MIVGSAHVVIRAITDKLQSDIQKGLQSSTGNMRSIGAKAGAEFKSGFEKNSGMSSSDGRNQGNKFKTGLTAAMAGAGATAGAALTNNMRSGIARGMPGLASMGGGMGGMFGNAFRRGFDRSGAAGTFTAIALRVGILIPVLGTLVGALSNVVTGLFAVAAAAGSASRALVVIPSMLAAIVQGGAVLLTAFSGIGNALSLGFKAAAGTTAKATEDMKERARDAAESVRDATRALARAEEQASRMIRDATRAVSDAKRRLVDTVKMASRAQVDAADAVIRAERNLADSHDRVREAQEALNDARKDAMDRLLDLQFASEGGALAERRAIMELEDARYRLNSMALLPVDNRLRMEAQLAYEEADLNLRMIQQRNKENAEELSDFKQNGVEGSEEVQAAQENLIAAQEAVRDAIEGVTDALRDQKQVQLDNARAIADAQQAVKDAQQNLRDAYQDAPEMIRDAREALRDAKRAQVEANEAVRVGGTEINQYQEALDKLDPSARRFVEYLVSLRGELVSLRRAAQDELFPRLEIAIGNIVTGLFPSLRVAFAQTARAIGDAAIQISKDLTSPNFLASFEAVAKQNATTIKRLGFVFGDLTAAFVAMLDAARPVINMFTKWLMEWADGLRRNSEGAENVNRMRDTFVKAAERMKVFIEVFKNIGEALFDLGSIADNQGMRIMRVFRDTTEEWANFTDSKANRKRAREFFTNIADGFIAISGVIKQLAVSLGRMGEQINFEAIAKTLKPAIRQMEKLFIEMSNSIGPKLGEVFTSLLKMIRALVKSGAIEVMLDIFKTFFDLITRFANSPVGGQIVKWGAQFMAVMYAMKVLRHFPGISFLVRQLPKLGAALKFIWSNSPWGRAIMLISAIVGGLVLMYQKVEWFRNAVNTVATAFQVAMKVIWDAATALWDYLFGNSIFPDMVDAMQDCWDAITAVVSGAWTVIKGIFEAMGWIIENVLIPVFKFLWEKAVKPAFKGITLIIKGAWVVVKAIFKAWQLYIEKVLAPVIKWLWNKIIAPAFKGIGKIIKGAWDNVIKPVFKAMDWFIEKVLGPVFKWFWEKIIRPVWDFIKDKIKGVWDVIRGIFEKIRDWLKDTLGPRFETFKRIVRDVWDAIKTKIENVWTSVRNVFTALRDWARDTIPNAFEKFKTAITNAWNKLEEAAKKPVRFVINTIYNQGIRRVINAIPGIPGELPKIEANFAKGGVLPGWSPGRDIHQFYSPTGGRLNLSGGEAIMRPEFTRAIGGERGVARLNQLARIGKLHGAHASGGVVRSFFLGGVMPLKYANSVVAHGLPYYNTGATWAGDINSPYDLADPPAPVVAWKEGTVAHVFKGYADSHGRYGNHVAVNHGQGSSWYAHLSSIAVAVGKAVAAGQMLGRVGQTGNAQGAHLHFEVRGAPASGSTSAPGVSGSDGAGGSAPVMSLADRVKGFLGSLYESGKGLLGSVLGKFNFGGWIGNLREMGEWGTMMGQMMGSIKGGFIDWVKDKVTSAFESSEFSSSAGSILQNTVGSLAAAGIQGVGKQMMLNKGWAENQWPALQALWTKESGWNYQADNPTSSAYGIPQGLVDLHNLKPPYYGERISGYGATAKFKGGDPKTQIAWGLNYIKNRYGSPQKAWEYWQRNGSYDMGGIARGTGFLPKATPLPERVLNPRQTVAFERLVDALEKQGGTPGGQVVNLDVHVPHSASSADVVHGIVYELHRARMGGRYRR